jgi:hypothetical protein
MAIALLGALPSCVSRIQSAGDWPLPTALVDDVCPDISGNFDNVGQSPGNGGVSYLWCELSQSSSSACSITQARQVDRISIDKAESVLRVSAHTVEGSVSSSIALNDTSYQCKGGWLTIVNSSAKGYSSSAAEFSTTSRSFALTPGYLLERRETEGVLLVLVLPMAGKSTSWFRYPVVGDRLANSLQGQQP